MKKRIKLVFGILLVFAVSYVLSLNFIVPIVLSSLLAYLDTSRSLSLRPKYKSLYPLLLFVLALSASICFVDYRSGLFIPFSVMPMLLTILFGDLMLSLLFTVGFSIILMFLGDNTVTLGVLALVSGVTSILLVFHARKREVILRAGFFVGLVQLACFYTLERFHFPGWKEYLWIFLNGIISGVITLPLLMFFEYLFKVITNMSLLELSDTRDNPLLREMILNAPGTYHHSLVVGNLAEAAAEAIGANALLARVGSYYHDIGKVAKAGYFIENQLTQDNTHEALAPSMSKLVVMNHVKEGIDLARKYKINPAIIDFISQHHGTSLVYYFYRRALEESDLEHEIKEEVFRYPGPRPQTKETAIVLLADSVEAASRSIKEPSPANMEELVHKIVNNKFIDGQLDDCDLTLRDLETISKTFIRILGGIYHARVTYPEDTASEDRDKKSTEESSRHHGKDKKSRS
ncbi:MAG: HDIG domain-containing protein [Candidatus Omnitrophica bacterium]|nr:HDIG domain-containing protein [Candidatus Omnitrophota bacterium]MDD5236098.1 HDIG domain-containing protein [Candidatus Omnitrophota bacterium]MDD5610546.1 HDIG domain-containing protein [Candidatus Omnitrophota bacterium]